jgi:hypothetical protein
MSKANSQKNCLIALVTAKSKAWQGGLLSSTTEIIIKLMTEKDYLRYYSTSSGFLFGSSGNSKFEFNS